MIKVRLKVRGEDAYGSGAYGASRGDREHQGVDCLNEVIEEVLAPVTGKVTKIGFPYAQEHPEPYHITGEKGKFLAKKAFRYVEFQRTKDKKYCRVMYVNPSVKVGDAVVEGETGIGTFQDLQTAYGEKMPRHIHVEVFKLLKGKKTYFNPEDELN